MGRPKGSKDKQRRAVRPPEQRFWEKVNRNGPNGCWEWTGACDVQGYARFTLRGKPVKGHRFAYALEVEVRERRAWSSTSNAITGVA